MFKRILSFLLFGVLLFSFVACGESSGEDVQGDTDSSSSTYYFGTMEDVTKSSVFKFSYQTEKTQWKRGETYSVDTALENISGEVFPYSGTSSCGPHIEIYCGEPGNKFSLSGMFSSNTDIINGIQPGETYMSGAIYTVPEDAPLGKYHILLTFEDYYQFFENAIEIVE
ncbi:MAG: hypothetical protein J6C26_08590 [Clostridia bacterium]|nr:hypothetical protein [Clostridia bacterium]